jgi:hypothetical protein
VAYTAAAAIKAAEREIGTRETGTNRVKYNDWLGRIDGYPHGGYGYPWCASFLSWIADQAGGRAGTDYPRTAGCLVAVDWFRRRGRWSTTPHAGDWVFYGPSGGTHVELVVKVSSGSIVTIGGNTSGSLEGQYFNGDGVYRKTVSRSSSRIYGYGRPDYQEDEDMPLSDADLNKIRDIVWNTDTAPAPSGSAAGNPTWRHVNLVRDTYSGVQQVKAAVAQLAQQAGADPATVAALVLAGLPVEAIADAVAEALPPEVAEQFITALGNRLTPKEGS